jgi:hypothetical protein
MQSDCRDGDRCRLWSCLCVRGLVGDRKRYLERSWVTWCGVSTVRRMFSAVRASIYTTESANGSDEA